VRVSNGSPSVTPRRLFFEISFPIYPYRIRKGENRISLDPREKSPKTYVNPLLLALEYREALDGENPLNQADLARSLNVTPARINQYLRLLQLPDEVKKEVLSGRVEATERGLRRKLVLSKRVSKLEDEPIQM